MTEKVKHEIKQQAGEFLGTMMAPIAASLIAPIASSLIQLVLSSLINAISRKAQKGGFHPLWELPVMMRILGKWVRRSGGVYNCRDHLNKIF